MSEISRAENVGTEQFHSQLGPTVKRTAKRPAVNNNSKTHEVYIGHQFAAAITDGRHVNRISLHTNKVARLVGEYKAKGVRCVMDEGRKRVLLTSASILAARKLAQYDSGARVPATVSAIADSIRWAAEQIMEEIDRRHPAKSAQQQAR
jgi:hypothetical protein